MASHTRSESHRLIAVSPEGTGCGLAEQNHLPNKGWQETRDIHMDGTIVDCSKVTSCVVVNGPGFFPLRRQQIAAWIDPVETASAHPLNCGRGVLMVALARRDDFLILRPLRRTPPLEADGEPAEQPILAYYAHDCIRLIGVVRYGSMYGCFREAPSKAERPHEGALRSGCSRALSRLSASYATRKWALPLMLIFSRG